jgi:sedoheptulose-bisphosphatase
MTATQHKRDLISHLTSSLPTETRSALRSSVIPALLQSIASIAKALRSSVQISQVGTANAFGDDQLNVDVVAEEIIRAAIAQCPWIYTASSEEDPVERKVHGETIVQEGDEQYTISFDPLDGSSIIAPNWTVGTIIGIWDGPTALHQNPEKQIASILGVYGPRTTAIVAIRIPGFTSACFEVAIEDSVIEVVRTSIRLQDPPYKTRYFAPANLRAAAEDEKYLKLINYFISQKYILRYSGGLVPDVVHALVKGHGVFVSPVTAQSKAKLRWLFELAPVALIVECAGGYAIDSATGKRILGTGINDIDQRGGLICGTKEEVEFIQREINVQ